MRCELRQLTKSFVYCLLQTGMNRAKSWNQWWVRCPKPWTQSFSAGLTVIRAKSWLMSSTLTAFQLFSSNTLTSSSRILSKASLLNSFPAKPQSVTISSKISLSKRSSRHSERLKILSNRIVAWCSSKAHWTLQSASSPAGWWTA